MSSSMFQPPQRAPLPTSGFMVPTAQPRTSSVQQPPQRLPVSSPQASFSGFSLPSVGAGLSQPIANLFNNIDLRGLTGGGNNSGDFLTSVVTLVLLNVIVDKLGVGGLPTRPVYQPYFPPDDGDFPSLPPWMRDTEPVDPPARPPKPVKPKPVKPKTETKPDPNPTGSVFEDPILQNLLSELLR